jgi:hypothetical protein
MKLKIRCLSKMSLTLTLLPNLKDHLKVKTRTRVSALLMFKRQWNRSKLPRLTLREKKAILFQLTNRLTLLRRRRKLKERSLR